ncbi:SurA N-terminal domain-containing protein [Salidesulfovibrio onnuriiensis]|uniref:SurA N-terminal domain-containing protein n=1 Tax=Salidesulfovibrio onnuriiensis TaxID=2583823 RepID=UPI00164FC01A|nr:SurA N-terminal domain-containing protein [Salidesulfovibrio onnuriiensis]
MRQAITLVILAFLICCLSVSAWGSEYMNRILVKVNDSIITEFDLNEKVDVVVKRFKSQGKSVSSAELKEIKKKLLDNMVEDQLMQQELDRFGVSASEEDIQAEIERMQAEYKLDSEAFIAQIEKEGMSYDEFKARLKSSLERQRLMGAMVHSKVLVTDTEVKEAYEDRKEEFSLGGGLHLAVIMLPSDVSPQEIGKKLDDGELTFEQAAQEYSIGPGTDAGGDIGEFSWKDLDEEWRTPLKDMKPGEVKGPVIIQGTNTFIKLIDKNEGNYIPFEEVKDQIYTELLQSKREKTFNDYFEALREKAVIRYMN